MIRKSLIGIFPVLVAACLTAGTPATLMAQPDMGAMMDDPSGPYQGPMGMMAGFGHGYGRGQGMMGGGMGTMGMGQGMMGGGPGAFGMLDLSDEQRAKINKVFDAERKQHWTIGGKLLDEKVKLRDLLAADEPDPKKVGAAYGEIAKLHQQMIEAHVQAANQARALLTAEQRDQLKQWRRGRMGQGMGMGPPGGGRGPMGPGNMPDGMMGR